MTRASSYRKVQPQQLRGALGRHGDLRIAAVNQHLNLDLFAADHPIGISRWDPQSDFRTARRQRPVKRVFVVDRFAEIKTTGVLHGRDKLARVPSTVLIEQHGGNVFDLGIDRVAENNRLHAPAPAA